MLTLMAWFAVAPTFAQVSAPSYVAEFDLNLNALICVPQAECTLSPTETKHLKFDAHEVAVPAGPYAKEWSGSTWLAQETVAGRLFAQVEALRFETTDGRVGWRISVMFGHVESETPAILWLETPRLEDLNRVGSTSPFMVTEEGLRVSTVILIEP